MVKLSVRYNPVSNRIRWLVNNQEKFSYEIKPDPSPDFPIVVRDFIAPEVPFPAQLRMDNFGFGFNAYRPLFNPDPVTGKGIVNPAGSIITFPTDFLFESYDCFDSNGTPVSVGQQGYCPLLDGSKLLFEIHDVRVDYFDL